MIHKLLGRSAITNISSVNVFDSYTILFIKGDKSSNTSCPPVGFNYKYVFVGWLQSYRIFAK